VSRVSPEQPAQRRHPTGDRQPRSGPGQAASSTAPSRRRSVRSELAGVGSQLSGAIPPEISNLSSCSVTKQSVMGCLLAAQGLSLRFVSRVRAPVALVWLSGPPLARWLWFGGSGVRGFGSGGFGSVWLGRFCPLPLLALPSWFEASAGTRTPPPARPLRHAGGQLTQPATRTRATSSPWTGWAATGICRACPAACPGPMQPRAPRRTWRRRGPTSSARSTPPRSSPRKCRPNTSARSTAP
jgi:hypothetical protein